VFAVVARTASTARAATLRGRAARVTHTLLFIVALVVSPGVCDACASGCSQGGRAAAGIPSTGAAFAVAATHGCPSCCGTISGGPPEGTVSPDASPAAVADAADGISSPARGLCCGSRACCASDQCGCMLAPRDDVVAVVAGEPLPELTAVALATVSPLQDAPVPTEQAVLVSVEPPPRRPFRVLYGVWRN
jgi:hypothetical protein